MEHAENKDKAIHLISAHSAVLLHRNISFQCAKEEDHQQ